MRQPFFGPVRFNYARVVFATSLALTLFAPRAKASQVVAFGYNMGVPPVVTNSVTVGVVGYSLAALLADGTVAQWGNSATDPGVSNVVNIATGWTHGFGLRTNGAIMGWGWAFDCGGSIPGDLTNAVALAVGWCASLAVRADGSVTGWGDPSAHLLNVPAGLSNVVAVSVGAFGDNALVLRADGTVWEWGNNYTNIHPELSNVVAVAAANSFRSAVLHFDGHVTAWPNNPPDNVPPGDLTNIIAIAGGGNHLLALRDNGTVVPWGCECQSDFASTATLTNVTAIAAGGGDGYDYSIFLIGHSNPPPVLSISRSNNAVRLTLAGSAFRRYVIEQTDGPNSPPVWTFKQNVTLPANGQMSLEVSPVGHARFYRVRFMP